MFAQADGPTALRSDLVRFLSISMGIAALQVEGAAQRACAALGGVWNGRKGYVALLVRWLDAPALQRYSYSEPLLTLEGLSAAVQEGIGFAETMGFTMDSAEYLGLSPEVQEQRLRSWNELRSLDQTPAFIQETTARGTPKPRNVLARISVVSRQRDESELAGPEARLRALF